MPPSNAHSTTAVNGSADEFACSSPTPKTLAQVEANKALALAIERINTFTADTSIPVAVAVTVPGYFEHPNKVATRCHAAAANIKAFEKDFNSAALKPKN